MDTLRACVKNVCQVPRFAFRAHAPSGAGLVEGGGSGGPSLVDVLAQLPPDVVNGQVWQLIDNVPAFTLVGRGALQLVRATKQRVDLCPAAWGGEASGDDSTDAVLAGLALYVMLDTLGVKVEEPASTSEGAEAEATVTGEHEHERRLRAVLQRLPGSARLRMEVLDVAEASKDAAYQLSSFAGFVAERLPRLRSVELRLERAGQGAVAALAAALPLLTSCKVHFKWYTPASFQAEVDAAAGLPAGLVLLHLAAAELPAETVVELAGLPWPWILPAGLDDESERTPEPAWRVCAAFWEGWGRDSLCNTALGSGNKHRPVAWSSPHAPLPPLTCWGHGHRRWAVQCAMRGGRPLFKAA